MDGLRWLPVGCMIGVVYLAIIMWWVIGHTPGDLVNAITDNINQLQQIAEALK